jgi:N-acetyl-gamma-glutamyl-phosphate reductase
MIKVGIAGATGYTGSELIRLLLQHPEAEIVSVTSERAAGSPLHEIHPQFRGLANITLQSINEMDTSGLDVLFLALPHRISMKFVAENYPFVCPVIDLSGDFRLSDAEVYECWYGEKHKKPELLETAVYGLPELFRDLIRDAKLISNPGCYPTSAILPLTPLVKEGLVQPESIVIDSKSGMTGAGASVKENTHFPNVHDSFAAYGLKTHRHTPEIEMSVQRYCGNRPLVQFTPHLLPINRGIQTNIYATAASGVNSGILKEVMQDYYGEEPFIRILNRPPQLREVRGSNFCDLFVTFDERTNRVIALSAIDNLMKGAAGQAVQNMNLVLDLPETTGLMISPVCP